MILAKQSTLETSTFTLNCRRSSSRHRIQNKIRAQNTLPALKEWAPAVSALQNGDQTLLFRKGGVKEPLFTPKATAFLLFPTAFHTEERLLKPAAQKTYHKECLEDPKQQLLLHFNCIARITGCWRSTDPEILSVLDDFHIYGPQFLDARLRWRPNQPITIMELRAYSLAQPISIDSREEFWGCFSWVNIDSSSPFKDLIATATPAIEDSLFREKQNVCRGKLIILQDLEEVSLSSD